MNSIKSPKKQLISLLLVISFIVAIDSQYMEQNVFKPDITFGEDNDRFDVASLIRYQNEYFKDDSLSRRVNNGGRKRNGKWIVLNAKGQQKALDKMKNIITRELEEIGKIASSWRRSGRDIYPVDHEEDADTNLDVSLDDLAGRRSLNNVFINLDGGRRKGKDPVLYDEKKEPLLKYAVPIEMIVNGYLLMPTAH